ncbi:methyl-accepting chemotaxis protein [Marinomonas mediterranea]|uniref:methyl-accepting chemotaxis protein n=1 Tax=Marinomonas mediterranea TaxID=119864 RepID=UPI00234A91B7|nr:methyl-accepting chemotaxis protein [Marinomonas mediterranea]WCN07593.1 HAMP domain-containing protein [Marinomonas mediterranea]WCN11692.1 HAMP domain-containing protein [Marinomonas mediterranea]
MFTSIKSRLRASYILLLVLLVMISGLSISRLQSLNTNLEEIVEENAALVELSSELNIQAESLASRLLLLFVLEERDQRVDIYKEIDQRNARMDAILEEMQALVTTQQDSSLVTKLAAQKTAYQAELQSTVEAIEFGEQSDAKMQMAGPTRQALQTFLDQANQLSERQRSMMAKNQQDVLYETETASIITIVAGITAIIAGLVMSILITNSIVTPLKQVITLLTNVAKGDLSHKANIQAKGEFEELVSSVESMRNGLIEVIKRIDSSAQTVVTSTENMGHTVNQVHTSSHTQDSMASEIESSVNGLTDDIRSMASHVSVSRNQAQTAHELAQKGSSVISATSKDIISVASYIDETSQAVAKLNEDAAEVAEFVTNIRNIAEQTNLLALNASIEAARAGESGRGFAVVADEVRNLANNTADVTESIDKIITSISTQASQVSKEMEHGQEKMRQGVAQIDSVVEPLSQLEQDSAQSLESLDNLNQLAQHQAEEAEGIANRIREIVAATQENNLAAKTLASLSDDLTGAANATQSATSTFRLP